MQKILIGIVILISFGIGFMIGQIILINTQKSAVIVQKVIDRSLDKYTIDNLSKTEIKNTNFEIGKIIKEYPTFIAYEFSFEFNPNLDGKTLKKTSGLINIPKNITSAPIVVMIRGYVDPSQYFVGEGTQHAGDFFAANNFITIAPDFLGYAESDKEAENVFESRFQTYTTVIALLNHINSKNGFMPEWDKHNVFIWAHSNGGQIALTTLEVTSLTYPTALWAPVSKPFPFSILYYTDEANDTGKFLRRELAKFESVYDTDLYSLTGYFDQIKAPIQVNQGTNDDAVPLAWSDTLVKILKGRNLNVIYNIYPGADHNMNPHWSTAIQKDLEFFRKNLK